MSKVIIYPWNGHLAVTWPNPNSPQSLTEIAESGTPYGVPYRIVDASELPPDWEFFEAWTADFSVPDGYGRQLQIGNSV